MERTTSLALLCLATFLVLFPLTLVKPGWPAGLKADEPAYYLMALSLAHDFDLEVDLGDVRRLFDEFPDHISRNVILMSDDGWHTVYFGKPYLYSLLAAPLARFFGANALVSVNMGLLVMMIWLGAKYLGRHNSEGLALLFSTGFFVLSAGFAYVFWLQPELFNMAAIMVCLYLGLCEPDQKQRFHARRWSAITANPLVRQLASGAALSLAVYNKPMLGVIGLPVFFVLVTRRRHRQIAAWILGGALSLGLAIGGAVAFTGHPSAYLGPARAGIKVCSPHEMPIKPLPPPPPSAKPAAAPEKGSLAEKGRASWLWIIRVPPFYLPSFLEHLGYFLWGRHTGLLLYFPFSLITLGLFLAHARRSGMRWVLLGSLAAVGLIFLLWIPFNWHGGGGFIGNRYFVNVYPGFLFLVTRISPSWLTVVGYAAGGLLLGPTLFTPMGKAVPFPTLQAHVRNFPFTRFPLELGVKGLPGYHETTFAGTHFRGRKDVFLPRGRRAWIAGATSTEIWIRTPVLLSELRFKIESPAESNEIVLEMGEARERLTFTPREVGNKQSVILRPGAPTRTLDRRTGKLYFYRLDVTARTGEVREWIQHYPPRDCFYFPHAETSVETFYVGAELTYLGTPEHLDRNLYGVEWGQTLVPDQILAGETFEIQTRVSNRSDEVWPVSPPTRVNLSYHWQDATGAEVIRNGRRTLIESPVTPGQLLDLAQTVEAPDEPGHYTLVIDLVFEEVAWFASKNGGNVHRVAVEVLESNNRSHSDI